MTEQLNPCPLLDAELKECPFCGCKAARLYFIVNKNLYFAFCRACYAQTNPDRYKDYAVANWNNREKKRKKIPMLDNKRPCVLNFGHLCYSFSTVYVQQRCEQCGGNSDIEPPQLSSEQESKS